MPLPSLSPRPAAAAGHRRGLAGALLALWLACAPPAWAQLPPAIEADRLLQEAAAEMAKEKGIDWLKVVEALEAAEATRARMPENFQFHLGKALWYAGQNETDVNAAVQRVERYLSTQGTAAKYYKEALDILSGVKRNQADDKRRGVWERFEWADMARGELRDRKTGLVWLYCDSSYGRWNGRGCNRATVELPWEQALEYARNMPRNGGKPWRLPTRVELLEAAGYFPLSSSTVWTSVPSKEGLAYVVFEGRVRAEVLGTRPPSDVLFDDFHKTMLLSVRLVR